MRSAFEEKEYKKRFDLALWKKLLKFCKPYKKKMILLGVLSNKRISPFIIYASFVGLVIFLLSLANVIPSEFLGIRMDLLLFCCLAVVALVSYLLGKRNSWSVICDLWSELILSRPE